MIFHEFINFLILITINGLPSNRPSVLPRPVLDRAVRQKGYLC